MNTTEFWVVWNPYRGLPQVRHTTPEAAEAEADRLAKRVAKLKAEEADLDRDIDAKKAQAADLEARIAAAQEKARVLIGG